MEEHLRDEQLDNFIRTVANGAGADDSMVDDIAGSPTLWWSIRRQINKNEDAMRSPWPPIAKLWRRLTIGVPLAATAALAIWFFSLQPSQTVDNYVSGFTTPATVAPEIMKKPLIDDKVSHGDTGTEKKQPRETFATKFNRKAKPARLAGKKSAEVKSDFIALSYAGNPVSGQIVRVKVPSSMMLTLGLVATVEKPSDLVDAEIIVGDDGLTHAIRFIR